MSKTNHSSQSTKLDARRATIAAWQRAERKSGVRGFKARHWPIAASGNFRFGGQPSRQKFWRIGNCLQTPYGRVAAVTFVFPPRGCFLFASVLIPFLSFPQYVPHRPEDSAQRVARRPADAHFGLSALRIDCPGDQEERVLERHCLAMGSCGRCRLLLQHQPHLRR